MTCPPVNLSVWYMLEKSLAGLSVEKFSWETALEVEVRAFCLSSVRVEPMICLTCPAWRSMHGRNFMVFVYYLRRISFALFNGCNELFLLQ